MTRFDLLCSELRGIRKQLHNWRRLREWWHRMNHYTEGTFCAVFAALILLLVVSADLEGTRRQDRDNKLCAIIGRQVERDGVTTARERGRIARWECKKTGGVWVSARFYQA